MASKVRSAAIFYNGKRVGLMQDTTYDLDTNDNIEQTDDGTYFTDGRETTKVTFGALIPVAGLRISAYSDALKKNDVTIQLGLVDGSVHTITMRAKTYAVKSEVASGKLTGNFEYMGGKPVITG